MASKKSVKNKTQWVVIVHGVRALKEYETKEQALISVKGWKSRGWEFVTVAEEKVNDDNN
jgi:hypothetical protein